jgi:N-acetylglucosamine-6-sulfatase
VAYLLHAPYVFLTGRGYAGITSFALFLEVDMSFLRLTRFPHALRYVKRAWLVFLFLALILVPVKSPAFAPPTASATAPPNIVVIMVDDLDVRSLQQMLQWGLMPNLQNHIITPGSTFTNAFVTNSLCCPSRATFLTGQYAHNHRVLANTPTSRGVLGLDDTSTLATWLRSAGYHTGYIGKYLNFYGFADYNGDGRVDSLDARYIPPGWDDWQVLTHPTVFRMYQYRINDNGQIISFGNNPRHYQTDVLAGRAAEFVHRAQSLEPARPFFLTVMPTAPHMERDFSIPLMDFADYWAWDIRPAPRHRDTITQTLAAQPSFNELDLADKPLWLQNRPLMASEDVAHNERKIRNRLASMLAVDDLIGQVIGALQHTGTLENTVIVFTSDNGYMLGEHRLSEKTYAYEESIRVPLYVRAPGTAANQVISQMVLNNDLAPTLVDFAGTTAGRAVDGVSLRPLMLNPAHLPWRQRFLIEHWQSSDRLYDIPEYFALRTAPTARLTPNQLWVEYMDVESSREFYDLNRDPYQLTSLHRSQAPLRQQQMASHSAWLSALRSCRGRGCQLLEFAESR